MKKKHKNISKPILTFLIISFPHPERNASVVVASVEQV